MSRHATSEDKARKKSFQAWWLQDCLRPAERNDVTQQFAQFETFKQAVARRDDLIRTLSNCNERCGELGNRIRNCSKGARCGSGACSVCGRSFRQWFVGAAMGILSGTEETMPMAGRSGPTQALALTAVPIGLRRPLGDLHTLSMTRASDQLRTQLIRSGLGDCAIIGGFDFSFNEDGHRRWPSHWQPHWYLVIIGEHPNRVRNRLLRYFPADKTIPRPVRTRLITDPFAALSYVWKSVFFRRVAYIGRNGRQETRKMPLKPEQARELALYLDEYAPTKRLFFRNVRRCGCDLEIIKSGDEAVSVIRANEIMEGCCDAI